MGAPVDIAVLLGSYLLGSVSFAAVIVKRKAGVDLRTVGSGNLGATNAGRVLGRRWGLFIYGLDLAKGFVPAGVVRWALPDPGTFGTAFPLSIGAGAAAFFGHCWPVWHGFAGGKGVATASGVILARSPLGFVATSATFLLVHKAGRMVSLASILAALSLPPWFLLFERGRWASPGTRIELAVFIGLALVVVVRHRANIVRIVRGTEPRRKRSSDA